MEQGGQSPMENGFLPGQGSHHGAAGDPGAAGGPLGPPGNSGGDAEIRRAYEQQQQLLNNGGMPGNIMPDNTLKARFSGKIGRSTFFRNIEVFR